MDNFKTQLAQKLISDRITEIERENLSSAGGKPTLPIEKILSEIFHTIPRISFSIQFTNLNYFVMVLIPL